MPDTVLHLIPASEQSSPITCRKCGDPNISRCRVLHRDYICAKCNKDQIRQWETAHPDHVREKKRVRRAEYCKAHPEKILWESARQRARRDGVPFEIQVEDIIVPPCCPVLGIPLQRKVGRGGGDNSPSLDRIVPSKGYIVGNIAVISNRANRIKSDATVQELERVLMWLRLKVGV